MAGVWEVTLLGRGRRERSTASMWREWEEPGTEARLSEGAGCVSLRSVGVRAWSSDGGIELTIPELEVQPMPLLRLELAA